MVLKKNGHKRSQKAYNQADCLDKVSDTHSLDLSPSQKKKNVIWIAWAHYCSVLLFPLTLSLDTVHPILHITSDHWPAILPVHFLDPPTSGGGKTKEFNTQIRKRLQKFNLEPNTDAVSYSLHLVTHDLKRATLVFHYLFFIMFSSNHWCYGCSISYCRQSRQERSQKESWREELAVHQAM